MAQRARIVLAALDQQRNVEIVESLGVQRNQVSKWRARWASAEEKLARLCARLEPEGSTCSLRKLAEAIAEEILDDAPRSGAPPKAHRRTGV